MKEYSEQIPFKIVISACRNRHGKGKPCEFYEERIEKRHGKEIKSHYCHGDPPFCDRAVGLFLLNDKGSELQEKIYDNSS